MAVNNMPPLVHYDYEALEEIPCTCSLCTGYRSALTACRESVPATEGHKFRCRCKACRARKTAERARLAASNRRDTYSELSWISAQYKWRETFLRWAAARICRDDWKPSLWWCRDGERLSLGSWLESWLEDDATEENLVSVERLLKGE